MLWKATIVLIFCWGCNGASSVVEPTPVPFGGTSSGFSLNGFVKDTAFRDLTGARIEIIEGSGTGTSVRTDAQGRFFMPGPFSDTITVRASHEAHIATTKVVSPRVGSAAVTVYFWLESTMPTVDIAGQYLLTLAADVACTQLPDVARTRSYMATVARSPVNSPHEYRALLSGAAFFPSFFSSSFFMGVAGDFVRAEIDFDGIGITEEIAPSTYVSIVGWADAPATPSSISGPLGCWFEYCASSAPASGSLYRFPVTPISCKSSNHRFSLVRQGAR
jgi:hypothetical protein